jgi:hypothetical protein
MPGSARMRPAVCHRQRTYGELSTPCAQGRWFDGGRTLVRRHPARFALGTAQRTVNRGWRSRSADDRAAGTAVYPPRQERDPVPLGLSVRITRAACRRGQLVQATPDLKTEATAVRYADAAGSTFLTTRPSTTERVALRMRIPNAVPDTLVRNFASWPTTTRRSDRQRHASSRRPSQSSSGR